MAAHQRMNNRDLALQLQGVRVAAWGDQEAFSQFMGAMRGKRVVTDDTDAALAAFGLKRE